jgi:hypothetical protein
MRYAGAVRSSGPWPFVAILALVTTLGLDERGSAGSIRYDGVRAGAPSTIETDVRALEGLEDAGLSLARLLGADGRTNDALAKTDAWSTLLLTLGADLRQLDARPGIADASPRARFQLSWLSDRRARFELIGAVNRLDRAFLDPNACGEARLVYRLVLEPPGRPPSSLPMTVSVVFPQPKRSATFLGTPTCAPAARAWRDLPAEGGARVRGIAALFARLPEYTKVEINLQTFHDPSLGAVFADGTGYDDHAEYLLRSFDRVGDALVPRPLVDTPRPDLDETEKAALAAWIRESFGAIDGGSWVIPERFLAKRAISVTPRGFARGPNRVFTSLFGDGAAFSSLPFDGAKLVKSPAGLLRRLDQGTCQGCHETRSVAGFHLLGESRTVQPGFDAVAIARSAHVDIELPWRAALTTAIAADEPFDAPRPFAERKRAGPGRSGAHCATGDDPTFAGWTCAPGLVCHAPARDDVGACVAATPRGVGIGEACQDVKLGVETALHGAFVDPQPMVPCAMGNAKADCDPNLFGFPGGMCIADCQRPGTVANGGELLCGQFPMAGYENDCFTTDHEPIESCIRRYLRPRVLKTCDEEHQCRDDYACARIVGMPADVVLPPKMGVCVPTYSVYGLRVDGPLLDR